MKDAPKRPPGRPRAFDRSQALTAAMHLFWRHGYEGTSIAELTKAMGINAPSLYAAFGSKEQLYREALDLYVRGRGQVLQAPGPGRDIVRRMLYDAAAAFADGSSPPGCLVASGAIRCAAGSEAVAEETGKVRRLARDAIEQRITQAIADGELPATTDAALLARFFAAVIQGMSVQAVDGASQAQLEQLADLAMAAWPAPAAN